MSEFEVDQKEAQAQMVCMMFSASVFSVQLRHSIVLLLLHTQVTCQAWERKTYDWLITPPPTPNNWGVGNKVFQLIMKRIFMCNWFFIGKCISDSGLDFVLVYKCIAGWLACCLLLLLSFSLSFHFISFHLISSDPLIISRHVPSGYEMDQ